MKVKITKLLGLVSVVLVASCNSEEKSTDTTKENSAPASAPAADKFDSAPGTVNGKVYQMAELIALADSEWTVIAAKNLGSTLKGDEEEGTDSKESEGKFIYVRYKVTNKTKGNEAIVFTPTLQDSKGRNFEQMDSIEAIDYLPKKETTMDAEQLPSGVPKTFSAIFEVPKDADGLMFLARTISDILEPTLAPVLLKLN